MNCLPGRLPWHGWNRLMRKQCFEKYRLAQVGRTYNQIKNDNVISSLNCTAYSRFPSSLGLYTQVRFKKDIPKLHSDLEFPNYDPYRKANCINVKSTTWGTGDEKSGVSYVITFFGFIATSYALKSELTHFITYMAASADVLAMSTIEIDVTNVQPGQCLSFKWRGKPLFVKNRTETEISAEASTPVATLRHPQTPEERTLKPEWLVVIGICTHLGCVPIPNSGDWAGGFYCPCHGSHYDNVGRARKGPAPLNLEVPPYKFISDSVVLVG